MKMRYRIVPIVIPLTVAAAVLYSTSHRAAGQTADGPVVAQPSTWVAFSAEWSYTDELGKVHHAHIYRSGNGSERTEAYDAKTGEIHAITIKNIPQAKYYVWIKDRGWTEQPMVLPPGGWTADHDRVPADAVQHLRETREGFEVVRMDHPNSHTFMAPQLNMFVVDEEVMHCGGTERTCLTHVSNVRLGNQKRALFVPPPGEPINAVSEPGGIVFRPKG